MYAMYVHNSVFYYSVIIHFNAAPQFHLKIRISLFKRSICLKNLLIPYLLELSTYITIINKIFSVCHERKACSLQKKAQNIFF